MSKKIAILHPHASIKGGAIKMLFLIAGLLQKNGNKVDFFVFKEDRKNCFPELNKDLNIININKKGIVKYLYFFVLANKIKDYDIILCGNSPTHFIGAMAKIFNPKLKVFWYIQNIPYYFEANSFFVRFKSFIEKIAIKYLTLISNTPFIKKIVDNYYNQNSLLIKPAIDTDFFDNGTKPHLSFRVNPAKEEEEPLSSCHPERSETQGNDPAKAGEGSFENKFSTSVIPQYCGIQEKDLIGIDFSLRSKGQEEGSKGQNVGNDDNRSKGQLDSLKLFINGRLVKGKNVELAIESYFVLKDKFSNLKLYIAGDGEERNNLEKIALGDKNIIFLGELDQDEIKKYYNISDIVLFCSKIDSFGLVAIEGMSSSKPVVALSYGGIKDVIKDGENGYLAGNNNEFIEKVEFLLNNIEKRESIGNKAREFVVNNYSIKSLEKDLKNLI